MLDQNDLLAEASEYEERAAVLASPSFRFVERDMEREARQAQRLAKKLKKSDVLPLAL